ncbi:MAG: YncE family protein [Thaumarchaeota archaeon]|nr:YncE family protein [Nitrososphaerota archaeon]
MVTSKFFILFASIMICIIAISSYIQIVDANVIVGNPDRIMAINPNTNKIYMTDYESENLLVINGSNGNILKEIKLLVPYYVNLNPNTNKVYVVTPFGIVVVDGVTDEKVNLIYSEGDTNFIYGRIAINSDTNKIYVTKKSANSVAVIDGITDIVQKEIAVKFPAWIHIDQKTNTIYVSDGGYGTTTIIDGSTDTLKEVVTSEKTGARFFTAINLDTNKVYQTNPVKSGPVLVFDISTHELIKRIEVGSFPKDIVVNPNTNKIYVSNEGDGTISVIDGNTDEVVKTFTFEDKQVIVEEGNGIWFAVISILIFIGIIAVIIIGIIKLVKKLVARHKSN